MSLWGKGQAVVALAPWKSMTVSDWVALLCLSPEPGGLRAPGPLVDFIEALISRDEGNSAKGTANKESWAWFSKCLWKMAISSIVTFDKRTEFIVLYPFPWEWFNQLPAVYLLTLIGLAMGYPNWTLYEKHLQYLLQKSPLYFLSEAWEIRLYHRLVWRNSS